MGIKIQLATLVLLGLAITACHKDDKAEKLMALESAYQSGVFTRQEYESKKAALLGTPPPPPVAVAPAPAPVPPAPLPEPAPSPVVVPAAVPAPQPPPVRAPAVAKVSPPTVPAPAVKDTPPPPVPATVPAPIEPPAPPVSPARPQVTEGEPEPAPAAGCVDRDSGDRARGVQERFYPASVEAVKRATEAALQNLDFVIHKDDGRDLEASKRRHIGVLIGAGGERMVLRFEKAHRGNQNGTIVRGETKKQLIGRMAQKSWTTAVLAQIGCQLRGM